MKWFLFGDNLIGDQLMTTPAIRARKLQYPEDEIVYFFGNPKGSATLMQGNPYLSGIEIIEGFNHDEGWLPDEVISAGKPDKVLFMTPATAFDYGVRNNRTLVQGFGNMMGVEFEDLRYDYHLLPEEVKEAETILAEISDGKPVVIFARHSHSCSSNDPRVGVPNKCVNNTIWVEVARELAKDGYLPVAVGSKKEEDDPRYSEWVGKKLYGLPLRTVAAILKVCAGTLSVDTGIRHLAAAVGGNMYCISGAIALSLIRCVPIGDNQKIYEDYRPLPLVTSSLILDGARKIL